MCARDTSPETVSHSECVSVCVSSVFTWVMSLAVLHCILAIFLFVCLFVCSFVCLLETQSNTGLLFCSVCSTHGHVCVCLYLNRDLYVWHFLKSICVSNLDIFISYFTDVKTIAETNPGTRVQSNIGIVYS